MQAVRPAQGLARAWRGWGHWDRIADAVHYLRSLGALGVPVRYGRTVVRALGEGRVEAAVVAELDQDWRPIPGTEQTVACDAICLSFGFVPQTDLPRLLGCEMRYHGLRGGWVPTCDQDGLTSAAGVYVAGETAGIGGAQAAQAEGELAGLAAARSLGATLAEGAERQARQARLSRERARAFTDLMLEVFAIRPGLLSLITDDTMVCRCEAVSAGKVRSALTDWCADLRTMKTVTRAGMGMCQGRTCAPTIVDLVTQVTGVGPASIQPPSVRSPLTPVPVPVLAELAEALPATEGDRSA